MHPVILLMIMVAPSTTLSTAPITALFLAALFFHTLLFRLCQRQKTLNDQLQKEIDNIKLLAPDLENQLHK